MSKGRKAHEELDAAISIDHEAAVAELVCEALTEGQPGRVPASRALLAQQSPGLRRLATELLLELDRVVIMHVGVWRAQHSLEQPPVEGAPGAGRVQDALHDAVARRRSDRVAPVSGREDVVKRPDEGRLDVEVVAAVNIEQRVPEKVCLVVGPSALRLWHTHTHTHTRTRTRARAV